MIKKFTQYNESSSEANNYAGEILINLGFKSTNEEGVFAYDSVVLVDTKEISVTSETQIMGAIIMQITKSYSDYVHNNI